MSNSEKPGLHLEVPPSIPLIEIARSIGIRMRVNAGIMDHMQYCDDLEEVLDEHVLHAFSQRVAVERDAEVLKNIRETFNAVSDDLFKNRYEELPRRARVLEDTLNNVNQRRETLILTEAVRIGHY